MNDELDRKLQQLVHEQTATATSPLEWTAVSERASQTAAASRSRRWPAVAASAVLMVAGVAVITLVRSDGSDTGSPATKPAGPDASNTVDSTDDQAIGGEDGSADTTSPPSSAPDEPGDPDDPAVTTRTARIVGVEVSESDTLVTVTFLQAPVPCEQFHEVTLGESPTRVEITVTVEVREQRDGERCPDVLTEETATVELQAPLGARQLVYDRTATAAAVSSDMSVDGPLTVGAEFEVSFDGSLRRSRGGYFWLQEIDGTRVAPAQRREPRDPDELQRRRCQRRHA